jgi:hypothetical protein
MEDLSSAGRRNCQTSGFVAAAAPTGNYGIDVHIDTALFGISSGDLLSTVQDILITPLWMGLVWSVHALLVMLEWCFTVDLLDSNTGSGVGSALRQTQVSVTQPWLPLVLAVASVLALYDGVVRRRVSETVGRALLMVAMMAAALWLIADPTGTVGSLGTWANQASLGTLAVAASGTPSRAGGALARSMDAVFATAIEAPWCYLEFGDVAWCRDPARLDPGLRAAALKIASSEMSLIGCGGASAPTGECSSSGSAQAKSLEHSAELLREARSNGAVFLALPANGPARNAINESDSLLRTLCRSSEATNCRGPTAAQAEFRTNRGTWPRLGGLLLIAGGVLGMLLLFGFIALRLLAAAIFSLLYLLLTPAMVLAPALGERGRDVFRRWATHLLGAVVSKLLFAFLLGVVLAVLSILAGLQALGWWTQWLLMSAFWWGAYMRRHQALAAVGGSPGHDRRAPSGPLRRRVREALETPRTVIRAGRWTKAKLAGQDSSEQRREHLAHLGRTRSKEGADDQVTRTLERDHHEARTRLQAAPETRERLGARRSQLERVRHARSAALAAGDVRRAAELQHRGRRVEGEIKREQRHLRAAHLLVSEGGEPVGAPSATPMGKQRRERELFLDSQASLPGASEAIVRSASTGKARQRRDYAGLAGLAGYTREGYERLAPGRRRAVRLEIDRELAQRRELQQQAMSPPGSGPAPKLGRQAGRRSNEALESSLSRGMRDAGYRMPASRATAGGPPPETPPESSVMRDAREVAARRKRQLGTGRR